jgi:hypothetical protein
MLSEFYNSIAYYQLTQHVQTYKSHNAKLHVYDEDYR